jgi:hypothetical protein
MRAHFLLDAAPMKRNPTRHPPSAPRSGMAVAAPAYAWGTANCAVLGGVAIRLVRSGFAALQSS